VGVEGGGLVGGVEGALPGEHAFEAGGGDVVVLDGFYFAFVGEDEEQLFGGDDADVEDGLHEEGGGEDGLDGGAQGLDQGVVQEEVEDDGEDLAGREQVVGWGLFRYFYFPLLF
jgi:hypothetical protein